MAKLNLAKLYKTQISLTEWFENSKHLSTKDLRLEDNDKRDRLLVLNEIIKLPFDKPTQFPAIDLQNNSPEFKKFFDKHKKELCALRLIPNNPTLPKLRLRGISIEKAVKWSKGQKVDFSKYKADFVPHGDTQIWSTIFVVNKKGIFGEIIKGGHYQLTQGFYDQGEPITFAYNFKKLTLSKKSKTVEKYLKKLFKYLRVTNIKKQNLLKKKFKSKFFNKYLAGYFETVDTKEFGMWYIDYNRVLGDLYNNFSVIPSMLNKSKKIIKGHPASPGKVTGKVKIIKAANLKRSTIEKDQILVCDMTTPDFLPLMRKSLGIITDLGGILSHAAIISRELKIPCITGTIVATKVLKNGDLVEIDTEKSTVVIL